MHARRFPIRSIVGVVLLVLVASSCADDEPGRAEADDDPSTGAAVASSASDPAAPGETVVLADPYEGVEVTLLRVEDDPTTTTSTGMLAPDRRLIAVELSVANQGDDVHRASSSTAVEVVGVDGSRAVPEIGTVTGCTSLGVSVVAAVGDVRRGCVLVSVPETFEAAAVRYRPAPIGAPGHDVVAEWDLARAPVEPGGREPSDGAADAPGVGDTAGADLGGASVEATVAEVVDPAPDTVSPREGERMVAVHVEVVHDGAEALRAPDTAEVLDQDGGARITDLVGADGCNPGSQPDAPAGVRTEWCFAFRLPEGAEPVAFQLPLGPFDGPVLRWRLAD